MTGADLLVRSRAEIEACLDEISSFRTAYAARPAMRTHLPMFDGNADALTWVLGTRDHAPLTGGPSNDDGAETIEQERLVATAMLHGENEMHTLGARYVSGVEHALMWVLGAADDLP